MTGDPIVEELHRTRKRILDDCGGDLDRLLDRYKSSEDQDTTRLVTMDTVRDRREREEASPGRR